MSGSWPALCTFLFLGILLVCIIRYQMNAFLALLVVSIGLGLAAGLPPMTVMNALRKGVGDILREVVILLALGAILGRLLESSGAAEAIARTLISTFGEKRSSLACLLAGFLIGIPVIFNVSFLLVVPIMWRLQKETGKSLLFFLLPFAFSLGITHSLIPPKPGIVGAVTALGGAEPGKVMVQCIVFGTLLGFPLTLVGWFGPGRCWANRQFVEAPSTTPPGTPSAKAPAKKPPVSFGLALVIVVLPLVLSLVGFGVQLLQELGHLPEWFSQPLFKPPHTALSKILSHSPLNWLQFLGTPVIALLVPTLLACYFLGTQQGLDARGLEKLAGAALVEVGSMVFLFGAAGGFKEVIEQTGAGDYIAKLMRDLPLPSLVSAYVVAVLMRIALGSATAAILTASALLASLSRDMQGQEAFLVLAVACGVTFMTQPADSGFWMLKEFGNLSVRDVMVRVNVCRIVMSLTGLAILLGVQMLMF